MTTRATTCYFFGTSCIPLYLATPAPNALTGHADNGYSDFMIMTPYLSSALPRLELRLRLLFLALPFGAALLLPPSLSRRCHRRLLLLLALLLLLLLLLLLRLLPSASTGFFLSAKGRRAKSSSDTRAALDLSTITFSPVSSILKPRKEAGVFDADRRDGEGGWGAASVLMLVVRWWGVGAGI